MNCSTNTMLKVAGGLGLTFGAAYFAFPAAQAMILASAPYLLFLICPISMVLMMLMMNGAGHGKSNENECASGGVRQQTGEPRVAVPREV